MRLAYFKTFSLRPLMLIGLTALFDLLLGIDNTLDSTSSGTGTPC